MSRTERRNQLAFRRVLQKTERMRVQKEWDENHVSRSLPLSRCGVKADHRESARDPKENLRRPRSRHENQWSTVISFLARDITANYPQK